jgi:hypothetical protein
MIFSASFPEKAKENGAFGLKPESLVCIKTFSIGEK